MGSARENALYFLEKEKQFRLGMLPTEQSNPLTKNLDRTFVADSAAGVRQLLSVDQDITLMVKKILASPEFTQLVATGQQVIKNGGRIVFSGCGATGRLSIQLEAMWHYFFRAVKTRQPDVFNQVEKYENSVLSIMTGGDYALIRSVEFFEDFEEFGKQQVRELALAAGDMLVAITEGGETSSVLGTVAEAADRKSAVFLMFNNPADILCQYIERSRQRIQDPRVTVLDLFCGPMAIAGSTRMQATTSELLVAGAALEKILTSLLQEELSASQVKTCLPPEIDHTAAFADLLNELAAAENTAELARYLGMEKEIYSANGLVTYFADEFLLDLFTDTTERAPTFMLPPFRKCDDNNSLPSWAFVKNPLLPTPAAWERVLGRQPRCLDWSSALYSRMGAPVRVIENPPTLDQNELYKFLIGLEEDSSRYARKPNIAISVSGAREAAQADYKMFQAAFGQKAEKFSQPKSLLIGQSQLAADYRINCQPANSILHLLERLAVKLAMNTISTGTMVMLGRVSSNWMTWVEVSNKKLRDRAIRLIAEMCQVNYREACFALHETMEEMLKQDFSGQEKPSPVQITINKIKATTQR